jgi:hypothetical protein
VTSEASSGSRAGLLFDLLLRSARGWRRPVVGQRREELAEPLHFGEKPLVSGDELLLLTRHDGAYGVGDFNLRHL